MSDEAARAAARRVRREPPAFRAATVHATHQIGPRLVRITLAGDDLAGLVVEQPAASVRLLLPPPGNGSIVVPQWNGNEFLLDDGTRPAIRTFTPLRADAAGEVDLAIVLHGSGTASTWASAAAPGDPAAISGPGRGYEIDPAATGFVLVGDETAIPAIGQLLAAIPDGQSVRVLIEVAETDGRVPLPEHAGATVAWLDATPGSPPGDALVAAVRDVDVAEDDRVWAAGEAAAMQRIRRHLFEEHSLSRSVATVRGYWKHGRAGGSDE